MPGRNQPVPVAALPPPISAPQSYPAAESAGVSGGGRGVGFLFAAGPSAVETTGTVAPRSVAAAHAPVQGGTTIIVGTSDTLEILARRYNVSPAAIMQANGYKGPRALSPGQQLIIPHPAASAAAAPALAAPASKPVAVASAAPSVHVVNHGDTLLSIARRNHVSVPELARANNLDPSAKLKLGMKLIVPGAKTAAAAPAARRRLLPPLSPPLAPLPPVTKVAAVDTARRRPASGPGRAERRRARGRIAGQGRRGNRRAADLPLAGARQGDHGLRRQGQRQVQ